jgi:diacylglycerol kinase
LLVCDDAEASYVLSIMSLVSSYLRGRGRSFFHAGSGLVRLVREEKNAQIHLLATMVVAIAGVWVRLSAMDWSVIVLCIALVWAAEAANAALERVADVVSTQHHPMIGAAKDLAAAAVLVAALGAALVGGLVFYPHLIP